MLVAGGNYDAYSSPRGQMQYQQLGWNPRQQNLPSGQFGLGGMQQDQQLDISHDGPGSMGNPFIKRAQPVQAIAISDFQQHLNAQRDAQIGMQDRRAKMDIAPGPFGKSLRQEHPYRPSPPRRGPGGFGGGGFGGGSQGLDQFMDFMRQMMDMFKQFNSQGGGGGGYGQRRGPGGFPQFPQQYGRQPQPAILRTQGPESLMGQMWTRGPESLNAQFRPHQTMTAMPYNPMWERGGPGEATLQTAQLTSPR